MSLQRVIKLDGIERTFSLDFNALIGIADATGGDIMDMMKALAPPAALTEEEIAAGEKPRKLPIGKQMAMLRTIFWAMSITSHPEFEGKPETASVVGSWFGMSDITALTTMAVEMIDEHMTSTQKSRQEFDGQLAPFVPSPAAVVEAAIMAAGIQPGEVVFDLGAGDGRVMLRAAEAGASEVCGWEQHPGRYVALVNRFADHKLKELLHFRNRDLRTAEVHRANVVFVYLLPASNEEIKEKLFSEMRPGARIVSHDFTFQGKTPSRHLTVRDEENKLHQIYVYLIPDPEAALSE